MRSEVSFVPPVVLRPRAVHELCRYAKEGNEAKRRHETFGFLFGVVHKKHIVVRKAMFYRGGKKTLMGIDFDQSAFKRMLRSRVVMAQALHLRFLGCFHSHMQLPKYQVSKELSDSDITFFKVDKDAALETLVCVWGGNYFARRSKTTVAIKRVYNYRIKCYRKMLIKRTDRRTRYCVRRVRVKRI